MSEKQKLTQYEKTMIAAAYNLKNYCVKFEQCEGCIFRKGENDCLLNEPWSKPAGWPLYSLKYRINEESR